MSKTYRPNTLDEMVANAPAESQQNRSNARLRGMSYDEGVDALAPQGPVARADLQEVLSVAGGAGGSNILSLDEFRSITPSSVTRGQDDSPWGTRRQLGAAVNTLDDLEGNRDGLWDNEDERRGSTSMHLRNPLTAAGAAAATVGVRRSNDQTRLAEYRARMEAQWGQTVTNLDLDELKNGELFAAEKAMALDRMGRTPSEVTEGFIMARGAVDGRRIAPRRIFWQRFAPIGRPSGNMIVVSPGFQETGRDFYEQITMMNRRGDDVIVMDHQWAGQSDGEEGGLDSGYGVARDVAAVTAFAEQERQDTYGDRAGSETTLFGNSMGAGPGVLGAMTLNDNGLIQLGGAQMPQGLNAVLQSPFLGATPNLTNAALGGLGRVPLLRSTPLPAAGVPVLTHNRNAAQVGAQNAVREGTTAQPQAMNAAVEDIDTILAMIADGAGPRGDLSIVHGTRDPLADHAKTAAVAELLGAQLRSPDTRDHVLQNHPRLRGLGLEALAEVAPRGRR